MHDIQGKMRPVFTVPHAEKLCPRAHAETHFVCILQMVIVDLLYGLEVNDSFHLGLVFVCSR